MSVAYDFAPTVSVPSRARAFAGVDAGVAAPMPAPVPVPAPERRPGRGSESLADVAVLHPPVPERGSVRLTRRGVVVLTIAVALLAGGLVWLARLSAPQAAPPRQAPHAVLVQPGDTLWGIATRVAPGADPQAEVDRLMRRNHLTDPGQLRPGMQLQVP